MIITLDNANINGIIYSSLSKLQNQDNMNMLIWSDLTEKIITPNMNIYLTWGD